VQDEEVICPVAAAATTTQGIKIEDLVSLRLASTRKNQSPERSKYGAEMQIKFENPLIVSSFDDSDKL